MINLDKATIEAMVRKAYAEGKSAAEALEMVRRMLTEVKLPLPHAH